MKKVIALISIIILSSCNNKKQRMFTLYLSDSDNWNNHGEIECDSFNMESTKVAIVYINKHHFKIKAGLIKPVTNY